MKSLKRPVFYALLLSIVILPLLQSCFFLNCGKDSPKTFTAVGYWAQIQRLQDGSSAENGWYTEIWNSDTIEAQRFALALIQEREYFTHISSGLLSSAYACSPADPYSEEYLRSIVVTADQDFGPGYPAGSDISAFFRMQEMYQHLAPLKNLNELSDNNIEYHNTLITLFLVNPPVQQNTYQFTIEISKQTAAGNTELLTTSIPPIALTL